MSAALSRRFGRAVGYPPIVGMPLKEKFKLIQAASGRQTEFEDLPERYQRLILEAEANRERQREGYERGDPYVLDPLWAAAMGTTLEEAIKAGALPGRQLPGSEPTAATAPRDRRRQKSRRPGPRARRGAAPAATDGALTAP